MQSGLQPPMVTRSPKILLIDDDADTRDAMAILLSHSGYDVLSAMDGADGLACLKNTSPPPNLIILDWEMPVMGGFEFLKVRLSDANLSKIPVIVVTGQKPDATFQADAVLPKPVNVDRLEREISRFVTLERKVVNSIAPRRRRRPRPR